MLAICGDLFPVCELQTAATHLIKSAFCASVNAAFPRILKNSVELPVVAIARNDSAVFCWIGIFRQAGKIDNCDIAKRSREALRDLIEFFSVTGGWPSCDNQRFTFSSTLPAEAPRLTNEMSATAPLSPLTRKLACRICESGCGSQFGGVGDRGG